MELSLQIATNIVNELNSVLPLKINIMNDKGVIIASSNPRRLGNFHDGALQVIENNLDELIVHWEGEFHGAKPGLNYPIIMQGRTVGVLGITGVYEEIVDHARIIKRMTELLLQNQYVTEQRQIGENVRNRYLDEWLTGDIKSVTADFIERGLALNIDITIPRRFIDCTVYRTDHQSGIDVMQRIEQAEEGITNYISSLNRSNLYFKSGASLVCAVVAADDDVILRLARGIRSIAEAIGPLRVAIGVDSPAESYMQAQNAYIKARRANKVCMRTHKWDLRFYNDLNMEVFADEINEITKLEYIHRIYKGYSNSELVAAVSLLDNYYEEEGSIGRTAERLFLHKNTLQYQLKRIAERTGYDPRSIRHSSLFYIANYLYRDLAEYSKLTNL